MFCPIQKTFVFFLNINIYGFINSKISPVHETSSTNQHAEGADDPAIWLHPTDPSQSVILGTDKIGGGIGVYDLQGQGISFYKSGRINNIDVRYDFELNINNKVDIVAVSNRTDNTIEVFEYDYNNKKLKLLSDPKVANGSIL